ncbi:MAG: pilus assembly protein [Planctomycetales bacterium]|nr:pilus assembly protein [Planctomycetales bacterium]
MAKPPSITQPNDPTTMRTRRSRLGQNRRRGSAMVEFAIAAPLLFFFFFAAFEFCRVAMIRHTVDNAVYEGCRQAIVPGATSGVARSTAANILGTLGLSGSTITVTPSTITNQTPDVTLTVEVSLDDNTFVPPQFFGGKKITRTLTMQREASNL